MVILQIKLPSCKAFVKLQTNVVIISLTSLKKKQTWLPGCTLFPGVPIRNTATSALTKQYFSVSTTPCDRPFLKLFKKRRRILPSASPWLVFNEGPFSYPRLPFIPIYKFVSGPLFTHIFHYN